MEKEYVYEVLEELRKKIDELEIWLKESEEETSQTIIDKTLKKKLQSFGFKVHRNGFEYIVQAIKMQAAENNPMKMKQLCEKVGAFYGISEKIVSSGIYSLFEDLSETQKKRIKNKYGSATPKFLIRRLAEEYNVE